MSDHMAAYFNAKNAADAVGQDVSEFLARLTAAVSALEAWKSAHVPHRTWVTPYSEYPLDGLLGWPTWEEASKAVQNHRALVRATDKAYGELSVDVRQQVKSSG
jgi:hypothetical protein